MNAPKLRFPGFREEWMEKRLGNEVFINSKKYNPAIEQINFKCIELEHIESETGRLLGYTDSLSAGSIKNVFKTGDVLFGKLRPYLRKYHQATFNGVCSSEIWVLKSSTMSNDVLFQLVQTEKFINITNISSGSKMPRADWELVADTIFSLPTLPEQQKIAEFLSSVDNVIQLLTKKKTLLENYKKGIMQKIFSQEIRFKDDDGNNFPEWEEKRLGEVLFEHGSKSSGKEEVFSVSVHKGVINQIEHLGRRFAASDTSSYKLVYPNDMVYTKSPTGDFPYGIIKQNKTNKSVIVSPLYGVFRPESPALGLILDAYFESPQTVHNYLYSIIQKGAKNTINISNEVFLSKTLSLPRSRAEQQKIADFLSGIDRSIEIVNSQIEKAKEYKKGLLQQMFV